MTVAESARSSRVTTRQLLAALLLMLALCAVNIVLYANAFGEEWSHRQRVTELAFLALVIALSALLIPVITMGCVFELRNRWRARS